MTVQKDRDRDIDVIMPSLVKQSCSRVDDPVVTQSAVRMADVRNMNDCSIFLFCLLLANNYSRGLAWLDFAWLLALSASRALNIERIVGKEG